MTLTRTQRRFNCVFSSNRKKLLNACKHISDEDGSSPEDKAVRTLL